MQEIFQPYKRAIAASGPILFRHVFLLVNAVIFSVVALLFIFGEREAALFLGIIIAFNILLGVIQDFRARVALEKLQLLTALRVVRLNEDGTEDRVLTEEIKKHDHIRLVLGDQVPCDGVLVTAKGFEVSEALITGESDSFTRADGEKVLAGSIVASGVGVLRAEKMFSESRIARMTAGIKRYTASPSPIQRAIEKIIRYSGYVLLAALVFVVSRGVLVGEPVVQIVKNAGALASTIVPQGLVVVTTLLFAFGAASYSRRHVLFQEINATEKLGRIKNLCMDKTGTLTDNKLAVEHMYLYGGSLGEEARELMAAYIYGSGDSSETIEAAGKFIGRTFAGEIREALPFSSWRQYGAVRLGELGGKHAGVAIGVGSPDIFLPHIVCAEEKEWLEKLIATHSEAGKRVLCLARIERDALPRELSHARLQVIAVFVFQSTLREGIHGAIKFFQERGVRIRILTGDNLETARAVASSAGVMSTDRAMTGKAMEAWSERDYLMNVPFYTIFARIVPEQKVKIIEALKSDGFTAMVGDGANDALAIKRSDLGIAMFDGAPATRQLAAVVLMNNSFTALPGGVKLADNFIRNIEIFTSIFLNGSFLGFFFFLVVSMLGYAFPLTPLNMTLVNYFAVGLPGVLIAYWAIRPIKDIPPASTQQFLQRVVPFPLFASLVEAVAAAVIFVASPNFLKATESNTLVLLAFIALGFIFFIFVSGAHSGALLPGQKRSIALLGIFEVVLLWFVFTMIPLVHFFDLTPQFPSSGSVFTALLIVLLASFALPLGRRAFLQKIPNA